MGATLEAVRSAPDPIASLDGRRIRRLVARFGSPLLVIDCDRVREQYHQLQEALPGVELYSSLKPLPHPAVVAALRDEGSRFDVASRGEVSLARRLGVSGERCLHSHPMKTDRDIRETLRFGCRIFTVDSPDEIRKFARFRRRAELLLRISFRSPHAVCDLSRKYGCHPEEAPRLLALARSLGIPVRGLSFHVGSQCSSPETHVAAIAAGARLLRDGGTHGLSVLDIGGGFPVRYRVEVPSLETFCAPIRAALAALPAGTRVVAEPGRFLVAAAGTALSRVVGRALRDGRWWYYLDDGVYGSYSGQLFDHARYPVESLRHGAATRPSVLAGPTCDSIDVIDADVELPELAVGDIVVGRMMGAYTWASATRFNLLPRPRIVVRNRAPRRA